MSASVLISISFHKETGQTDRGFLVPAEMLTLPVQKLLARTESTDFIPLKGFAGCAGDFPTNYLDPCSCVDLDAPCDPDCTACSLPGFIDESDPRVREMQPDATGKFAVPDDTAIYRYKCT